MFALSWKNNSIDRSSEYPPSFCSFHFKTTNALGALFLSLCKISATAKAHLKYSVKIYSIFQWWPNTNCAMNYVYGVFHQDHWHEYMCGIFPLNICEEYLILLVFYMWHLGGRCWLCAGTGTHWSCMPAVPASTHVYTTASMPYALVLDTGMAPNTLNCALSVVNIVHLSPFDLDQKESFEQRTNSCGSLHIYWYNVWMSKGIGFVISEIILNDEYFFHVNAKMILDNVFSFFRGALVSSTTSFVRNFPVLHLVAFVFGLSYYRGNKYSFSVL